MDDTTGVYNSTTISYENPGGVSMGGGGGSQRRAWNLSEIVNPPATRSRWFHWIILMGGSIFLGLGLIVVVIGIYNQHYYDPESQNVKRDEDESPPSHWIVTLVGFGLAVFGIILLVIYCRLINTNRLLCNPLSRTRNALRQVVTKPRYHPGRQTSRGGNLLSNDGNNINPMLTQYNPTPDMGFRHANGEVTSEEKANLMANEMKEGIDDIPISSCEALLQHSDSNGTTPSNKANSSSNDPRIVLHPFAQALRNLRALRASLSPQKSIDLSQDVNFRTSKSKTPPAPSLPPLPPSPLHRSPSPSPPQRPPRHKFSSLRRDLDPYPAALASQHYKPRHFAGHGYGQGKVPSALSSMQNKAPLASLEDITPSLRSSFASVMMYPPSDWGNSDESFDSTIMINLSSNPTIDNTDETREGKDGKEFAIPDSQFDTKFDDFRISPSRHARKSSLSSVQSAFS